MGSNRVDRINVRIIAATSVDLQRRVAEGRFREDLFYRLNVLSIRVPPLRERMADIDALCESILEQIEQRTGLAHRELTADAIERLRNCVWRGNVRGRIAERARKSGHDDRQDSLSSAADLGEVLPADLVRLPFPGNTVNPIPGPQSELKSYEAEFVEFRTTRAVERLVCLWQPGGCRGASAGLGARNDVPKDA